MKARQHRKTVQRRMKHWIAGASWRRIFAQDFADIEFVSAFSSKTRVEKFAPNFTDLVSSWPWPNVVIDESTQLKQITKDHQ